MLTKNAIGNLKSRYVAVLKKCNLLNVFGSLAVAGALTLGIAVSNAYAADGASATSDIIVNNLISATGGNGSGFDNTNGNGYTGGSATAFNPARTNTQSYTVRAVGGNGSDGNVSSSGVVGSGGYGGMAEATGVELAEIVNNSGNITVEAIGGNGGNGGDSSTAFSGTADGGNGGVANATGIRSTEAIDNSGDITVKAIAGKGGNGGVSSISSGSANGGSSLSARAIGLYLLGADMSVSNSGTITASATNGQGGQGGQTSFGTGSAGFSSLGNAYGIYTHERNGNINNIGTINISNTYNSYGIFAGDGDVSGTIINNRGKINIEGMAGATTNAYGIRVDNTASSPGIVTINNYGYINVDTTATNNAEVSVLNGEVYVDNYATSLRDYATYGNVFDITGGTVNFNNTVFLARMGIGEGFMLGQEYYVSDMVDNSLAVTGKIASVVTDIRLLRATLTGTEAQSQSIALYTNINENTDISLQQSLNQLNTVLNNNDRLGLQQFLSNNGDLLEDLADELTITDLLELKIYIQELVDNIPQLQELIASLDDPIQEAVTGTPSFYEGDPVTGTPQYQESDPVTGTPQYQEAPAPDAREAYSLEVQAELNTLNSTVNGLIKTLRTNTANELFAGALKLFTSSTNLTIEGIRTVFAQNPGYEQGHLGFQLVYEGIDDVPTGIVLNASDATRVTPEFQALQEAVIACFEYATNFSTALEEGDGSQVSLTAINEDWIEFFYVTIPAFVQGTMFEGAFTPTDTNSGTNSGSQAQGIEGQDVVVSDFVNDFVDGFIAPNMSASEQTAPQWSVNISPYGSASNADTSNGSSFGISGGISRIFNEKFTAGVHFDVNYSSSNADMYDTDSDVWTTSLGVNANYNISENWYVGGQITGAISQTDSDYETGAFTRFQASDEYSGYSFTTAINTGYLFEINEYNIISPEIGLSYVYQHTDKNSIEWNNNGSYMNVYNDSIDYSALYGTFNLRWIGQFALEDQSILKPFVSVGIRQNLTGNAMESGITFMDTRFITEATPDLTTFIASAGLEWIYGNFSVSANYNGAFGSDNQNHGGSLNFSYSF